MYIYKRIFLSNLYTHYIESSFPIFAFCQNNDSSSMAEDQLAASLKISNLHPNKKLANCVKRLLALYDRNLVDLKKLDPQCASESGEKLVKLIWYHKVEALEPAEKACHYMHDGAEIKTLIEKIELHMQNIWKEYSARNMREFDKSPKYISRKSTMELLLCIIVETQGIEILGKA